ncbi:MAG: hypothetical protein CMO06_15905 [Thalassospira sp.]|nr:hypothetical protein [Thalassospira sp.]MAZ33884.1 hypothetical protein [Thalassospira sp.]MAZ34623.1 hypothetical protein [Thalassospira sp.]
MHEPKGASTASSGEVYVADGAGSGSWQNPLGTVSNLNSYDLNGLIDDVSTTGSSVYFRVARNSVLTNVFLVLSGALSGSDSELSLYRDGILLGQSISLPVAGSGDGVKLTKNLSPTYTFTEGQVLKIETNGASTNAVKAFLTCKFTAG